MEAPITVDRLRFLVYSLKEKLWVKPLGFCLLSIFAVFLAKVADGTSLAEHIPEIKPESVETLLSIMASSMMVIATFSAGTMVNAYASASQSSTPRSLSLIISDDVSQNALSVFIGAFIYSAVALTAMTQAFFNEAGLFILFCLTCLAFVIVILTFIRWVDSVARLGRVGPTLLKVEAATTRAVKNRIDSPCLGAVPQEQIKEQGSYAIFTEKVGYIQLIDIAKLQALAKSEDCFINVTLLPGEFVTPERPLAYTNKGINKDEIVGAFTIGEARSFEADPRFGFIVLAEIASRALSPSVNDHGTAINAISSITRLMLLWHTPVQSEHSGKNNNDEPSASHNSQQVGKNENKQNQTKSNIKYDRVSLPKISVDDLFDDAYASIARDGAANIEVAIRIQKSLNTIKACFDNSDIELDKDFKNAAHKLAKQSYERAKLALNYAEDIKRIEQTYKD
ncbi:DUF2254 domain-containing protein [Alteromonas sp. PRIM-21]|uniref:DUF2254 domain-containing protein n=1 Tax=Alteromonas sp. PRIM-21 TaxID=1454978 RepID=UPI0022B97E6D|nr:DUF2254 domain-containing protein [Alteromonas sp. PRIM-21]MCZ8529252.1 DUF2254 domain-containing protein [Alteromonas sp. PRIM-21]